MAITRAQALLILIGNPDMLRLDENWKTLVENKAINDFAKYINRKYIVNNEVGHNLLYFLAPSH